MISDIIFIVEGPILFLEVGAINIQSEVNLGERFSDKSSLRCENDPALMAQLWEVPSMGKGGRVKVLIMIYDDARGREPYHEVSQDRKVLCFH